MRAASLLLGAVLAGLCSTGGVYLALRRDFRDAEATRRRLDLNVADILEQSGKQLVAGARDREIIHEELLANAQERAELWKHVARLGSALDPHVGWRKETSRQLDRMEHVLKEGCP